MLNNQTVDKLRSMKLPAMAAEFVRQTETPNMDALNFEERVGMMADAEWLSRENNRIKKLSKEANPRVWSTKKYSTLSTPNIMVSLDDYTAGGQ